MIDIYMYNISLYSNGSISRAENMFRIKES